jgi:hypothetical protein
MVKDLKSFFLFSLIAILKASKSPNSSASKISLERPKARHFLFHLKVFQAIPAPVASESSLDPSDQMVKPV